jgi:2-dehydro-3-deoxyphosphogluconate aldolase/(4S)-4-hydroxy-2-oxoglutarate aldolase
MTADNQDIMSADLTRQISGVGVIAVLEIEELRHAVPVAHALLKGGVSAIELTLRTPAAMDAARAIISEVPEILLGLGTVLKPEQVKEAAAAGVAFAVAPGCNPRVIDAAREHGLAFAPGIATPSDIEIAVEAGCRVLKYFPAESSGGIKHLASIAGPYSYLGIKYIPLGGLNINNAAPYLESPLVCALGGSWLAKRNLIKEEQWDRITNNAREISGLINEIRK